MVEKPSRPNPRVKVSGRKVIRMVTRAVKDNTGERFADVRRIELDGATLVFQVRELDDANDADCYGIEVSVVKTPRASPKKSRTSARRRDP